MISIRKEYLPMIKHEVAKEDYEDSSAVSLQMYLYDKNARFPYKGDGLDEWAHPPGELAAVLYYLKIPYDNYRPNKRRFRSRDPVDGGKFLINIELTEEHKRRIVLAMAMGY